MTTKRNPEPLKWASRLFDEAVMGFLALVALATATGPLVFDVSARTEELFNVVEWAIIGLFIAEFIVHFATAPDRSAWLRSPWRLVDAVSILGPLVSLLPHVSEGVRGALAFRLLRVGRAVAFGARAGVVAVQHQADAGPARQSRAPGVTVVEPDLKLVARPASWDELLGWSRGAQTAWYHAANIDRERFVELATHAGFPDREHVHFHESAGGTHIKTDPGTTTMFLWLPTVAEEGFPAVTRDRLIVRLSQDRLLTATSFPSALPASLDLRVGKDLASVPFSVGVTYRVLGFLRDRYRFVAARHEDEIRRLEELRLTGRGAQFLADAFRLQREMSAVSADLWRLKGLVRKLSEGRIPLPGTDAKNDPFLDNVLSEIDDADNEFDKLKEDLQSLTELHINVTSFEMNKFMKLLAVVSFLGLIPSVTGGLLGMNVMGQPWAVTLGQVAFCVAMGMAVSLYVFAIKGWLR